MTLYVSRGLYVRGGFGNLWTLSLGSKLQPVAWSVFHTPAAFVFSPTEPEFLVASALPSSTCWEFGGWKPETGGLSDTDPFRQDSCGLGSGHSLHEGFGFSRSWGLKPSREAPGLALALPLGGRVPVCQSFHFSDLSFLTRSTKEYFNQPGL